MNKTADIGREFPHNHNSVPSYYIKIWLVLSKLKFILLAMSCSTYPDVQDVGREEGPCMKMQVKSEMTDYSPVDDESALDIFTFDYLETGKLDSYQREESVNEECVSVGSRTGSRLIFICANGQWLKEDWTIVNSREALDRFKADIEKEHRRTPLMTGESVKDGTEDVSIPLEMLSAEIVLNSICCDFKGKGYEGSPLTDVKVYLIDVNASCSITTDSLTMPERIINYGGLCLDDMERMDEPGLLYAVLPSDISQTRIYPGISLRCYPNTSPEESPGSPFTKLVIEGQIEGETYYWPIETGASDKAQKHRGIRRNCRYIYDLTITGKGSRDPGTPIRKEDIELTTYIEPWTRKDLYTLHY